MDSAQYKHVVLGLIFLKYVSDILQVRRDGLAELVNDPTSEILLAEPQAKQSVLEDRDESHR
jgi:type I restriction enzyme M protein